MRLLSVTYSEQDRQCTYNVPLRRVRVTIAAVKSCKYYTNCVCICSLRYRACYAKKKYIKKELYTLYSQSLTTEVKKRRIIKRTEHDTHKEMRKYYKIFVAAKYKGVGQIWSWVMENGG